MTFINIDDFPMEIDDDFFIDYYRLLLIVIDFVNRSLSINDFFGDFDFYRFPISININRRIKLINIDDID